MTVSVQRQWQHFKATPCGRRFQTRHRLRRSSGGSVARKVLISGMGVLVVLAGIVMIVLPGPGMLAIILGAALIAEESLFAARVLDRFDLWVTGLYKRWRARRA